MKHEKIITITQEIKISYESEKALNLALKEIETNGIDWMASTNMRRESDSNKHFILSKVENSHKITENIFSNLPKNGTRTKKDIDKQMKLERNW